MRGGRCGVRGWGEGGVKKRQVATTPTLALRRARNNQYIYIHCVRKWEERDIGDLKRLIELTMYWFASREKTREFRERMARGNGG